ncbi:MAG: hypothetical protein ACON38_18665 [Akkermansiaceae bacterium]
MDHTRDNPLKRFNAFWFAALLVTTFGIGTLILWPLSNGDVETAMDLKAGERLALKEEIGKAQDGALNTDALAKAMEAAAKAPKGEPTPGSMAVPTEAPEEEAGEEAAGEGEEAEKTEPTN